MKGLAKFRRRTLYANIVNDRSTVYYTTAISKTDPYTNLENIKINYLKGYEDVIVDPDIPVGPSESNTTFNQRFVKKSQATIGHLPVLLAMTFFIPVALVAFLINSGVQSLRSNRRIRLHERGLAGIQPGSYRVPLLITGMREAVEDVYENLNSAQSHEYLAGTDEEAAQQEPRSQRGELSLTPKDRSTASNDQPEKSEPCQPDVPILALAPYQFSMIQALNQLGWRRYPVHIHKVWKSHAAIVVRVEKPSFDEGKVVLRHWLDEEFIP